MGFLSRILGKNKKQKPHNFSKIMRNRDRLVIFLPKDNYESYNIVTNVVGMQTEFEEVIFFIEQFAYTFFSKLKLNNKYKFRIFDKEQPIINEAVMMNFTEERTIQSFLKRCIDSTIIDINNEANMQFVPAAENSLELFERFCEFYNLKIAKKELILPISNRNGYNKTAFCAESFSKFCTGNI